MKYTSAQAAKLLKKLNTELESVQYTENASREFLAASGENTEDVRPAYDYRKTQDQIEELEGKIRTVKHALNLFNVSHTVPGFEMTIDQMLIYIPQLSRKCEKLYEMKNKLPKARDLSYTHGHSAIIDYRYMNYDIAQAAADYETAAELLAKAQLALDRVNNETEMEIDL